ncbi:MAG: alkaline phosphatase family protein [Candidatus Hydrogenedentota bacterium]
MVKVAVIGIDSAVWDFVFNKYKVYLPNLQKLMNNGVYGIMESTIPAVTVPAWSSMMSGKDPGQLGVYGFRNRKDYSYTELIISDSLSIKEPRIWDILSRNRKQSIVFTVPQTYPPKPLRGQLVGCFLTPDNNANYTYPESLKEEIERTTSGFIIDVREFRTEDKERLLKEIYEMTDKQFFAVKYLLTKYEWDFFMMVQMGIDRIQHGFWRFCDEKHRLYEKGNKYEFVLRDYYIYIDRKIGELIEKFDNDTVIFVVSDHGSQNMYGGVCINEVLIEEGLLKLKEYPAKITQLKPEMIDWERTYCFGEGGYFARLFLNVKDREERGIVHYNEIELFIKRVEAALNNVKDKDNNKIKITIYRPQEIYKECKNIPPDAIIYFGDLSYRSVGSVGYKSFITYENDTGPDDSNHHPDALFILSNCKQLNKNGKLLHKISIYDIAPTILTLFNVSLPPGMIGKSLI